MHLLKVEEVAERLSCSVSQVYALLTAGRLAYVRIGVRGQGGKRIRDRDLEEFIEANLVLEKEPTPAPRLKLKHLRL